MKFIFFYNVYFNVNNIVYIKFTDNVVRICVATSNATTETLTFYPRQGEANDGYTDTEKAALQLALKDLK